MHTDDELEMTGPAEPRFSLLGWAGLAAVVGLILLMLMTMLLEQRQNDLGASRNSVIHSHDVLNELDALEQQVLDAETGQRGFIITKQQAYLLPYLNAQNDITAHENELKQLLSNSPEELRMLSRLKPEIADKMSELHQTIDLRQKTGPKAALKIIMSNRGRLDMDSIRNTLADMKSQEHGQLLNQISDVERQEQRLHTYQFLFVVLASAVFSFVLFCAYSYLSRLRKWYLARQSHTLREARRQVEILSASVPQLHAARERLEESINLEETIWNVPSSEPRLIRRAKLISQVLSVLVTVFALVTMIGCLFGIDALRNPTPWGTDITFNAALCLLLTGIGAFIAHTRWRLRRSTMFVCGAVVTVIAGVSLCEWIFGFSAGMDQVAAPRLGLRHILVPGRMPESGALAFTFLGLSILAQTWPNVKLSQLAAFTTLSIGLVTLTGHTYGFGELLSLGNGALIAFPMSIALILAGVALLLVNPESDIANVCVSKSLGGKLLRRLVPLVLFVPALGLLSGIGQSSPLELMLLALTTTVLFPAMVWLTARTIDRLDRQKDLALSHAVRRKEELELLNRELQDARDQALEASNLKSAFVANISHELRTPLSGIIGNLELLMHRPAADAEHLGSLRITMACAQSLLNIVNDLLDLSKIESGKFSLDSSTFSLTSLAHDVAKTVSDSAQRKGLLLKVDIDPRLPSTVEGDKGRIQQVLLNLVNNAVKFTPDGAVQTRILLESSNDGVCRVRFEVADTGIGISEEDQQLLFKPFSQVDSSATRKYGGAGLGLSLSKNLVDLMGGKIGVHSAPDTGSTFWFVLPLAQSKTLDFSPPAPEPIRPVAGGSNKLVLVVEDNIVVQKLVLKQLGSIGVQAMAASTGRDALELLQKVHFDLILMDCNLPDLSGLDVTRLIRAAEEPGNGQTPIVAMTAAAMKGDRDSCLSAGMNDYLSKPVTIKQLSDTVHKWTNDYPGPGPAQTLHTRL